MHHERSRPKLLARIRARVGASHDHWTGGDPIAFCLACGADGVETRTSAAAERCRCAACGHEDDAAFRFDGRIRFAFRAGDGELVHHTVGALCAREGHVLLYLRRRFPYAYTLPAGHLEAGEEPSDAVVREVGEETGLLMTRTECLVREEALDYRCSRGAGVHVWHLFAGETAGEPRLSEEARILGWYDRAEIARLDREGRLTPPTGRYLRRFGWMGTPS